jgi:hypothetical protein
MKVIGLSLAVAFAASALGCGGSPNAPNGGQTFAFDFSAGQQGWIAGFADYPSDNAAFYELVADYRPLPAPLDGSRRALYVSAFNASGDVFLFYKRQVTGLKPGAAYMAAFEVEIATNIPTGCVGIGSPPGEGTYIKAGASADEPMAVLAPDGRYLILNIDKGNQASSGKNALTIGNAANSLPCQSGPNGQVIQRWELKRLQSSQTVSVSADAGGAVWFVVGIDSAWVDRLEFFITQFKATVTPE